MISDLAELSASAPPSRMRDGKKVFTFSIPTEDAKRFASVMPFKEVEAARVLLAALARIHAAPKVVTACKAIAATMKRDGWSAERLRTKYYAYTTGTKDYPAGDWRICVNHAKARLLDERASLKLRPLFVEYWRGLGESFHQDWAAAHDELLRIWRTKHNWQGKFVARIPGYETWPAEDPAYGHPEGWSYTNLMRYQSDIYDQTAARNGHSKASQYRIPVLTTRTKGLQFGQYLEFDDHEFNQRTLFQKRPMRPLGFGCVEIFSACICHMGLKPTLWDMVAEQKKKLTEREFMWFAISVLTTYGYRHDIGTTLIGERGTSRLPAWFVERMERATNGLLKWYVGGRHGKPAHAGQFEGRSKGNFRTKALIEGSWALVDNQTAMLPAQTGRNRDDAPEAFAPGAGAERYTSGIIKAAEAAVAEGRMSEEQAGSLQFPYPHYWQWQRAALNAIQHINRDSNHDLEGWERLGFVQTTWRLAESGPAAAWLPWQEYLALPAPEQAVVKALLDRNANLLKPHRLSRHDVFEGHRKLLKPLAWELVPGLVGEEHALRESVPVRKGLLVIEDGEIDPDPLEFVARDYRGGDFLTNGERFVPYINPYAPSHLVACDASGRVVAVCPRYDRASRTDQESIDRLLGQQSSYEAQARQRLELRHADQAEEKQQMIEANKRILSGNVPRGKSLKNYNGDIADLATTEEAADVQTPAPDMETFVDVETPSTPEAESAPDTEAFL